MDPTAFWSVVAALVVAVVVAVALAAYICRLRRAAPGKPRLPDLEAPSGKVPLAQPDDDDVILSVSAETQRAEAVARMREDNSIDTFASSEDLEEYADEDTGGSSSGLL